MYFPELERYKKEYPDLSKVLDALDEYLSEIAGSSSPRDIVAPLVAKRLSIDEGLALSLLMLVHKEGLIEPKYLVYCNETENVIAEYNSIKDVPDRVFCPYHDIKHSPQEYYVELTFQLTPKTLKSYAKVSG